MTYEEYGNYYPYQTNYRNTELVESVKEYVKSMSFSEIKDHIKEFSLADENDGKDWDEGWNEAEAQEICTMNLKVLSLSEPKLREFAFKDQKHLMMCHENEDIDQFIEGWLK
jgi:hypothetical protein